MSIINRLIIISTQLALALTITATDLAASSEDRRKELDSKKALLKRLADDAAAKVAEKSADSGVPHRSLSRGRSSRPSSVDSSADSEEDVSSVAGGGGGGGAADAAAEEARRAEEAEEARRAEEAAQDAAAKKFGKQLRFVDFKKTINAEGNWVPDFIGYRSTLSQTEVLRKYRTYNKKHACVLNWKDFLTLANKKTLENNAARRQAEWAAAAPLRAAEAAQKAAEDRKVAEARRVIAEARVIPLADKVAAAAEASRVAAAHRVVAEAVLKEARRAASTIPSAKKTSLAEE